MCDIERELNKETSGVEVLALHNAHKTADKTTRDIDKLNRLLKASSGITLKIHIATGSDNGRE